MLNINRLVREAMNSNNAFFQRLSDSRRGTRDASRYAGCISVDATADAADAASRLSGTAASSVAISSHSLTI